MTIFPVELIKPVTEAVNEIRRSIMPARVPNFLYHYTKESGFVGIVKSRSLRAGCAASLDDESEISHGAELLAGVIEYRLAHQNRLRNFTKLVLARLKSQPVERKDKTYVACFCEQGNVDSQWNRYGPYCLRFPTDKDGAPRLRPRSSRVFTQFIKATYKNRLKRSSLVTLVERIVGALENRSIVDEDIEGPWTASLVDMITFWISELALDVLVSFKSDEYRRELEWRMIVRPLQDLPGSGRTSPDQAFDAMVITSDNGKRYIEVFAPPPANLCIPSARIPVPFDLIAIGPCRDAERLRKLAERVLSENSLKDTPIELPKPRWWSRAL